MNKTLKSMISAFAGILFFAVSANAQITTSSLGGFVNDEKGEPIAGAAVIATHVPSGSQYYSVVNTNGRYNINGMRAGGPYKVEVSCLGYNNVTFTDITLALAEVYELSAVMKDDSQVLEEAIVISQAATKFATEKTGAATNITGKQISSVPTVSRSITDVTRLSPYGGNDMNFAGVSGRTANFTVDGANFNNNFGLSSNLPGGGNPISIDAIDEMQVVISPFDVRQTNFIGGGVNAITKSGTNTFKGSAYVYHRNQDMRGDTICGEQIGGVRAKDSNTIYGMTLGGPIIKNKLFFFVNAEYAKIPTVANRWKGTDTGKSDETNYISRVSNADLQAVKDYVKSKYGYDTGSYTDFPADESNLKLLARLDWNINDKNRLAVRYNYTMNNNWLTPSGTSMDGGTRYSSYRASLNSMVFSNAMYSIQNLASTVSVDLNSRISDNLSNQLLVTYSALNDVRGTGSDEFPFIDIAKDGDNYMSLGYELFSWNNAVHNTVINAKDDIVWYAGSHKVTGGLSFEYQMADNQYMRNGTGYYRYNSVDDFLSGATPEVVCLTYGYNGETSPAARVRFYRPGIYIQDEWSVNSKFKLTYGLRFDGLFFNNADLMTNQAIYDIRYEDAQGRSRFIDTGKWPYASITASPRIGFSWDVLGDKSLKVRGGTGLFSGRLPLVFFTNMPTNGGMVQYQAQINADAAKKKGFDMSVFNGGLVTDKNGKATVAALRDKLISLGYPASITPEEGTVPSSICGVDPDFKMPQVWKTSLAVDYAFPTPFPFSITAEGIYNKTIHGVMISDWSIPEIAGMAHFNGADNRALFPNGYRSVNKAFVLENTNQGYGWSGVFSLNIRPIESLSFSASYTHTVSKEITGLPGSNAESAFTYIASHNGPNHIGLHSSQYVTPDRFIASLTHNDKCGNHYSFIYETWRGGYNYSYMTVNDMNNDGYNYDILYIPTDKEVANNEYRFVSDDDRDRFMAYVHNNKYLSKHQGEYAEAYGEFSPWVHRIDFSYKHDFKLSKGKNSNILQLSLDIKNLLNLFNSSWGVSKYLNPAINSSDARVLKYEGVDADGYATFSTPSAISGTTQTFVPNHAIGQCWYASIGIKYMFN